mmetsp:Transcript_94717/g.203417  ORF Transcript_94717/g.203417 Transcript_94717/m.203417 type:complete len:227 (-) Transcript_94717:67-747(-)
MIEQVASPTVAVPARPVLRLPILKPPPVPDESELQLLSQLHGGAAENDGGAAPRNCGAASFAFGGDAAPPCRPGARRSVTSAVSFGARDLDDFLSGGASPRSRSVRGAGGRSWRQGARPSQRRPIDEETTVPAEVFESMMRLGSEARSRAAHTLAFALPDGKPYLRRRGEVAVAEPLPADKLAEQDMAPVAEVVASALARPPSACAAEAREAWHSSEASTMPIPVS